MAFCLLLLALAGFNSALAQSPVDARLSGGWYDPKHNGEGFLVEVLQDGSAVVYWFTYDESGGQRWYTGNGIVENDTAVFETLLQTEGGVFGERYDPDDVVYSEIGELSIAWSDCSRASAAYTVNGVAGSQQLVRLSTLAGLDCEEPESAPSPLSGSWFDQTHIGEGLVIEALNNGDALVYWFSYDARGQQAWFYGLGDRDENLVSIPAMYITSGGRFGPDFNPEQVELTLWGSLEVELGCEFGWFDYASALPVYGSGKQTLTRLTRPGAAGCQEPTAPNILLLIADDFGLDASNQYDVAAEKPVTPILNQLADEGLVFDNAWSNPTCSPTRAGILTGRFGIRTGVLAAGDDLSTDEISLQGFIHELLPGKYADAVIGKWHLGPQPGGLDHPNDLGVSYYAGIIGGGVDQYEDWNLVTNGQRTAEMEYTTSKLVDLAIDWTGVQAKPWFLWLAFNAPHSPFHVPPSNLHDRNLLGTEQDIEENPRPYYFAAIEAMDREIGRLLDALDPAERDNTIIIFLGDNGTPNEVVQSPFARRKAKGSLYQGGINIPFFITGPGVTRVGERESALVNTTDLFSTIAALAGVNVGEIHDSISFEHLLSGGRPSERFVQYSEQSTDTGEEWAISDGMYKLIESSEGEQELYQLSIDPFEEIDLVAAGTAPPGVIEDLHFLADQIRQGNAPGLP